jgi:hypothetical protein
MRRTAVSDTLRPTLAEGATTEPGFDAAYHELAHARAAYEAAAGDPDRVPELAVAAERLAAARQAIRSLQPAA